MTVLNPDPAFASQAAFHALMEAFARPGEIRTVRGATAPVPLAPATAALVQSLADYETPVWLDSTLAGLSAVAEWIRFHTGAPLVTDPSAAAFALVADPNGMPDFARFSLGSEEYPDRSTTVVVQIERFDGRSLSIEGPGIKTTRSLAAEPLPDDFVERLRANRELFPRGIDLVLVAGEQVTALPRSIRVAMET